MGNTQTSYTVSERLQQKLNSRKNNREGLDDAPAWFLAVLDRVHEQLIAGEAPEFEASELQACTRLLSDLDKARAAVNASWHLDVSHYHKKLALFALALRRCASAPPGDPSLPHFAALRRAIGDCFGLYCTDVKDLPPDPLITCLRGDALLVYNALLAEAAVSLGAHALLQTGACEGTDRSQQLQRQQQQQQGPDGKLPSLVSVVKSAVELLHESQALMGNIGGAVGKGSGATEPCNPDPLTTPLHSGSCSDSIMGGIAATAPGSALLARQCLQQGLLDSCCRVALRLLPVAHNCGSSAGRHINRNALLNPLTTSLGRLIGSPASRGMWLGTVAGRAPPPPASCPPLCEGIQGSSDEEPTDSRSGYSSTLPATANSSHCGSASCNSGGSSSGGSSSGSSSGGSSCTSSSSGSRQLPARAVGPLLPSSMQCLLAAHVTRMCAYLDGGPMYGLREGPTDGLGPLDGLSMVPIMTQASGHVLGGRAPQRVLTSLAVVAVGAWAHARGLWDGSAERDAWWLPAGDAGRGTGGGMGRGHDDRSAAAAAAVLRRQLAEAEAAAEAAEAAEAGPPSSAAAAAEGAAAAEAEAGRLAGLRRTLAALEVEAAAEQLPPLNRMATAALCRRLVAACASKLRGSDAARYEICDTQNAEVLAGGALSCWRLALARERVCPRRPPPAAAVRRLEAWWQAVVEVMAAQQQLGMDTHNLGSLVMDQVVTAHIGNRCTAPLPDSLPTCPQPDVIAAINARFWDTVKDSIEKESGVPGPALLLGDMQRQQGAWTETAMFGPLEQLVDLLHSAGVRMQAPSLDPSAPHPDPPLRLAMWVAVAAPLLDPHVVCCLVRLAQLQCANTQAPPPPPASDTPGSPGSQGPASPSSPARSPTSTASASADPGDAPPCWSGPGTTLPPLPQLGLVVSYTASYLLPHTCKRLLDFPCTRAARLAQTQKGNPWLHVVQATAGWVVQWLLLLLQVAAVDTGRKEGDGEEEEAGQDVEGEQEQEAAEGANGGAAGGVLLAAEAAVEDGQEEVWCCVVGVRESWRRQLLQELDVVGTLCGLVQLLVAYPRVGCGAGPGVEQLRDVVDPGPIAACLDAAAAVFPEEVHAAFRGGQEGQGGGGAGRGGRAVLPSLRWLLGKGGPLEVDGGSWVGSGSSCFWAVMEREWGGVEEVEGVLREAHERVGCLVGLVVPSEEGWSHLGAMKLADGGGGDEDGSVESVD